MFWPASVSVPSFSVNFVATQSDVSWRDGAGHLEGHFSVGTVEFFGLLGGHVALEGLGVARFQRLARRHEDREGLLFGARAASCEHPRGQ